MRGQVRYLNDLSLRQRKFTSTHCQQQLDSLPGHRSAPTLPARWARHFRRGKNDDRHTDGGQLCSRPRSRGLWPEPQRTTVHPRALAALAAQLSELSLAGCRRLPSLGLLRRASARCEVLDLNDCGGLTSLEPLLALPSLTRLELSLGRV